MTTTEDQTEDGGYEGRTPEPATRGLPAGDDALVEGDLLVEDVSIDGMCGVY